MICKYWTEYEDNEYCKLAKSSCFCGADRNYCTYDYLWISLCPHCFCMTKTIDSKCGKCKEEKNDKD